MAGQLRKEQTYGWYPSVRDIYLSKNQPIPYHLECLYKFKESGYYNPKAEPPESTIRIGIPAPPSSRPSTATSSTGSSGRASSRRAKSVPVPKFTPVPTLHIPTPAQCWSARLSETPYGVFDPNTPTSSIPKGGLAAEKEEKRVSTVSWPAQKIVGKLRLRAQRGWHLPGVLSSRRVAPSFPGPSNSATVGIVQSHHRQRGRRRHAATAVAAIYAAAAAGTAGTAAEATAIRRIRRTAAAAAATVPPATTSGRQERVKSACSFRAKPFIPQRPIHSAGPTRPPAQTGHSYSQRWKGDEVTGDKLKAQPKAGKTTKKKVQTKAAKVVPEEQTKIVVTTWDERKVPNDAEPLGRMQPPKSPVSAERLATKENLGTGTSYEEVVAKYGWRAEVHGDPYNIKKITERKSYCIKCEEPEIPPDPPGVHMENKETFFLNTIPRRPATFDVHQEWISETIHAKRMALQKKEGFRTRWKNFAFAY
ncbi:uncharacterized protein LOC112561434 [Pomacea canaliculata]|uniref:uncharacterized protein LOC112561434 n=1 Tax=Pomacea canaliculata TaxID=400727 RepID=UPI000D73242E|nr:uncharacterized protein LOC112561434 [Pomacea canaliculata]